MADPFTIMAGVGAVASLFGANKAASAQRKAGRLARQRGREQKSYNMVAANEVMAIGRMNAAEDRRQARLIASRAVAVAAAGGAVEDIDHLLADIYGEGAYRANVSLMEAQSQSNRLIWEGEQAEKYGQDQYTASAGAAQATRMGGYSSLLKTGATLFGGMKFGGGNTISQPDSGWNRSPF